jgi:integrase
MSVHLDRKAWRVRYRDANGRQRSRSFDRKGDAVTFDREMARRLQLGPSLAAELERQTITLAEFVETGFRVHAATLSRPSRAKYAWALERHLAELIDEPLLALDVPRIVAHQHHLLNSGRSENTTREALVYLSGILQVAVEHGLIAGNPVRSIRKPAALREEVRPLTSVQLETLIAALRGRNRILVVLAGHLGLRPMEARSVPWRALSDRTLFIGKAHTKATARRSRTIEVPRATTQELREWRLESGRPNADEPIVGNTAGGEGIKTWARRHLAAHAEAITGRADVTLYTLRHTHASLCHYAGLTVPEAARRLGHSPALHIATYAHVIDGLQGRRYADLDGLIEAARADLVFRQCSAGDGAHRNP